MAATVRNGEMKLQEGSGQDGDKMDSLLRAAEVASNINDLLVAQGKLKPTTQRSMISKKRTQQPIKKYDAEVEINDAPIICRDMLTRNSSQTEISKKSGAFISTKGRYISPEDRSLVDTNRDRPLYLYIQAKTEDEVQRAVLEINQIILKHGGIVNQTRGSTISLAAPVDYNPTVGSGPSSDLVNGATGLVHAPQPDLTQPPPSHIPGLPAASTSLPVSQVQFIEEKMFIGLEHAPPSFDVRSRVLGTEGSYLQHIHTTSGAVVSLRGRNSGYLDPKTAQESTEPMHIHLKHMTESGLAQAKQLANDLIKTVQNDYSQFQRELALQPPAPAISLQASASMGCHAGPSASLVSRQNVPDGVLRYQQPDQHVIFSSSGSTLRLAAPPLSLTQQPASQMVNLSRPPTYVQAAPPIHPVTTGLLTQAVGYNSLTSQGVEVVHKTIPMSRPLASIQPLHADMPPPPVQPLHAPPTHQVAVEGAPPATIVYSEPGTQAVPVSLHLTPTAPPTGSLVMPSQLAPIVVSQPTAVVATNLPPPVITSQPPPAPDVDGQQLQNVPLGGAISSQQLVLTSHPAVVVSLPPPIVSSRPPPALTNIPPPMVTSQPPPVMDNVPLPVVMSQGSAAMTSIPPPVVTSQPPPTLTVPVATGQPPPVVLANHPPPESHVVIVSRSGSLVGDDSHVPMISLSAQQTLPVMHNASTEAVTFLVQQPVERQIVCIDQPDVSVPPPLAAEHVGEGTVMAEQAVAPPPGQPVAVDSYGQPLEMVEILQPRPHHMPSSLPCLSECHVTGVPAPTMVNSVPRYPIVSQMSSTNDSPRPVPHQMDVDITSTSRHHSARHQISSLPPIEPPPHLADGYQSGKREYAGAEHRPPYRGSRRSYSAVTSSQIDGEPIHKRIHNNGVRHPPPPPPPL